MIEDRDKKGHYIFSNIVEKLEEEGFSSSAFSETRPFIEIEV